MPKSQPMTFAEWRETDLAWQIDDGEDDAVDRMSEAYNDYFENFRG